MNKLIKNLYNKLSKPPSDVEGYIKGVERLTLKLMWNLLQKELEYKIPTQIRDSICKQVHNNLHEQLGSQVLPLTNTAIVDELGAKRMNLE